MTLNKLKVVKTSWWHRTKINHWSSIYTRDKWGEKKRKM